MKNTIARKGNPIADKASPIIIAPYTVATTTEWVELTTTIRAEHAEYLAKQRERIIQGYGGDVVAFNLRGFVALCPPGKGPAEHEKSALIREALNFPASFEAAFNGPHHAPFTITIKKSDWEDFHTVASYLGCDPVAIIRAGAADRVKGLKAFHRGRASA